MADAISEKLVELHRRLYGPRYCKHCNQVQPVEVFKLAGSDESSFENGVYTASFVGAYACRVCRHTIEPAPSPRVEKKEE